MWPVAFTGVCRRRLAEDRIWLLSQEVCHRAKNMLAVVQSIARHTSAETDPSVFATEFSQRISGLAASLDLLVGSDWRGVDIGDLVRCQDRAFR